MSRTRQAIIAFWVVIIALLLWEFYDYDRGMTEAATEHPQQQHFFFMHTNAPPVVTAPAPDGAMVEQTGYDVQLNKPGTGSFTCRVTLKNVGNAKATAVQINVRPYKGIALGDVDVGSHTKQGTLSDTDPNSLIGQWVTFPDLAPGESATESAIFIMRRDVSPGTNPLPEILFESDKKRTGPATAQPLFIPAQPPHRVSPND